LAGSGSSEANTRPQPSKIASGLHVQGTAAPHPESRHLAHRMLAMMAKRLVSVYQAGRALERLGEDQAEGGNTA